jgi:ACT domain-containing protein
MITVYEAEKRFYLSRRAFYKAIQRGDIKCLKIVYKRNSFKYLISVEDAKKVAEGQFRRGNHAIR